MLWTYSIARETIPPAINRRDFTRCIERAMRHVEDNSGGMVCFRELAGGRNHVAIGFDEMDERVAVGNYMEQTPAPGRVVKSIAFDPDVDWSLRWWHFFRSQSLFVVAVHELGHLLGLPHTEDTGTVMDLNPRWADFNAAQQRHLRSLINA